MTHSANTLEGYGSLLELTADCKLMPQLYWAAQFHVDLTPYPSLVAVGQRAGDAPAFAAAHPDFQPNAERS
jgi:maleylpyruvate isomerase